MHVSTDTVFCNQLALDVEIGFHAVEQDVLQTVLVDLELSCDFTRGPRTTSSLALSTTT